METTAHVVGTVMLIASLAIFTLIIPIKRHTRILSDSTDAPLMMFLLFLMLVGAAMAIGGLPKGMPTTVTNPAELKRK